jgi:hypothetical protein
MTGEMEQLDAMDPQLMADMEAKYQASKSGSVNPYLLLQL